ncbi:hypothetical protein AOCH_004073 [Aspergillus ochraceoroseus]|uniref:DEAD box helicase involved in nonsense mediated decay n=1 Tax=Aspergillus ochraceoroseus TaxID=138278 RepID=A0A0F8WTC2_9EURO|nr:hypothetical protein AOCH_004073 [Aspergillus ochraceoroseus]
MEEVNSSPLERFQRIDLQESDHNPPAFVNKDISNYFSPIRLDDAPSWVLRPELPSSDEILDNNNDEDVFLVPNKIDGAWESKDAYLKAHYELLREDAVAPLRDAVAYVRNDPEMMDTQAISIYEKVQVYITGVTFSHRGLAFRIRFSTNRAGKSIAWDYSKRLISGSVIALSPVHDLFQSKCIVAVVAARPLEAVKQLPPEIDIFFADPADADFDPQLEWLMVEAKNGYYESARHTLTALQKMSQERFPLARYICSLNTDIDPPEYVKNNPVVELESAIEDSGEGGHFDLLKEWPRRPSGGFDTAQWAALEQILTRQLAIIQGPPGTGKTHVSVVALKILLSNMKANDPPIIISSQTNHAIDQILKYVSQFEKQYVRLGGRSSDPNIRKRTLYAIRCSEPTPAFNGGVFPSAIRKNKALFNSLSEILQPLCAENSDCPIPSSVFKKYNLLGEKQCDALAEGAKRWVHAGGEAEEADPLVAWLGDQVIPFEVKYTAQNFGFAEDEVDREYEQLKELEAEQGLDEDDHEILKGPFTSLRESYIGRQDSFHTKQSALRYLECDDMWKIPVKERGSVYNILRKQLKTRLLQDFRRLCARYYDCCKNLQIGRWERDYFILQNARVIGMTATGLSKYRALVSSLKPKIVLVEEAAEAIEAPIAAACLDSLQHMILVGDHQQLRGRCAVQDLKGDPFFLDVSMFERLVQNSMEYVTLRQQRRMAPEIRGLLTPIYEGLEDHESVKQQPKVPGMGNCRLYFFTHSWPESRDSLASKFNEKEAEMIVGFFNYLVLNNIEVKDITILTFYNGQRKRLLNLLKKHSYLQGTYVKVMTVDSYQGEENEIVILSLVRNRGKDIGFLSIPNRVCVALSRAKRGFYMFGNAGLLASANSLWEKVLLIMGNKSEKPRIAYELPLTCEKHGNRILIKDPSEWSTINGGCQLPCGESLPHCGHKCSIQCHSFSHDQVQCRETCNRRMACEHICKIPCSTTHTCSCTCEEARRLEYLTQTVRADDNWSQGRQVGLGSREQAVENYQAFAKGESKRHDAILAQKLESIHHPRQQNEPVRGVIPEQTGFDPNWAEEGAFAQRELGGISAMQPRSLLDD